MPFRKALYHKTNFTFQAIAAEVEPRRCPKRIHLPLQRYPISGSGNLLHILDISTLEVRFESYRADFQYFTELTGFLFLCFADLEGECFSTILAHR